MAWMVLAVGSSGWADFQGLVGTGRAAWGKAVEARVGRRGRGAARAGKSAVVAMASEKAVARLARGADAAAQAVEETGE